MRNKQIIKYYKMGRERAESNMSTMSTYSSKKQSFDNSQEKLDKSKDSAGDLNYKTELCRTWVEKNYCPYNEKCRFAHGKKDLHDKVILNSKNYKQKECNSFHKKGYCPYGPRCHFKHEERRLDDLNRVYYPFLLSSPDTIDKFLSINSENINMPQRSRTLPVFEQLKRKGMGNLDFKGHADYLSDYSHRMKAPTNREIFISKRILDSYM